MNKIKIIEKKPPKITPVRTSINTFKVKNQPDKTSIVYTK
jgi:hypothetical protein